MKRQNTYSKILHLIVLLSFLLPFFYTGCGPSAEEKAKKERAKQDSIKAVKKAENKTVLDKSSVKDTLLPVVASESQVFKNDTAQKQNTLASIDSIGNEQNNKEQQLSEIISGKYPVLRPFLVPKSDTYTGLGAIINSFYYIPVYAIFISFFLLILGFLIKFAEKHALLTIIILDFFALIFLFFARSPSFFCDVLWGYWVTFSLIGLLVIYDTFIFIKNKRSLTKDLLQTG